MQRFFRRRVSECKGKIAHETFAAAEQHALELQTKEKRKGTFDPNYYPRAYHCPHCGRAHVGHGPPPGQSPKKGRR